MSLRRLAWALICGSCLIASLGASVVALILAAHLGLSVLVGADFAWAILLGAVAALLLGAAVALQLILAPRRTRAPKAAERDPDHALALGFVRDRPVVAVALAAAGVLLAARNPRYLGAAVRAFITRRRLASP